MNRSEAVGCWLWDHYRGLRVAAVCVAMVLVSMLGPSADWTVLGIAAVALLVTLEVGCWASDRRRARLVEVNLDRGEWEGFAAEQGCSVDELLARAVALNQHLWRHRDEPLGVMIIDLLEWTPTRQPAQNAGPGGHG